MCCMYENLVSSTIIVLKISNRIKVNLESRKDFRNQGEVQEGESDVMSFLKDKSLRTSHKV